MKKSRRRTVDLDDHGHVVPRGRAVWWDTTYYDARGKIVRREMGAMRPGDSRRVGPAAAFDGRSNLIALRGPDLGGRGARRRRSLARARRRSAKR